MVNNDNEQIRKELVDIKNEDSEYPFSLQDAIEFVSISASTANMETLEIVGERFIRPNLHTFLIAKPNSFKSSILKLASEEFDGVWRMSLTFASFVGSIDKTSNLVIDSAAWLANGKALLIDEFSQLDRFKRQLMESMLSVLQDSEFSRNIAVRVKKPVFFKGRNDNEYFKVEGNTIEVKCKTSVIIASMYDLESQLRKPWSRALMERFVVIPYHATDAEKNDSFDGKLGFEFKKYSVSKNEKISKREMDKIREYLRKNGCLNVRVLEDCARIFAVKKKHDFRLYDLVMQSRNIIEKLQNKIVHEQKIRSEWHNQYGDKRY